MIDKTDTLKPEDKNIEISSNHDSFESQNVKENENTKPCIKNLETDVDHEDEKVATKPFSCKTCGSKFGTKTILKRHIYLVHDKKRPFECEICQLRFSDKNSLKRHIESVHDKKQFECEKCGSKFSKNHKLTKHINDVHEGEKLKEKKKELLDNYKRLAELKQKLLLIQSKKAKM